MKKSRFSEEQIIGMTKEQEGDVAGQSHAQRVRSQNDVAKAGRMRPEINTRILQNAGGEMGLRSREKSSITFRW